jgi:hypothetical protein
MSPGPVGIDVDRVTEARGAQLAVATEQRIDGDVVGVPDGERIELRGFLALG